MAVSLLSAELGAATPEGHQPVRLTTAQGIIEARWTPVQNPSRAVMWLGSAGGGFDSPAKGLYPRLIAEFKEEGIAALRVQFRDPTALRESVHDALAGMAFLKRQRVVAAGLVGHSFGGAVAAQAAGLTPMVRALVLLATQSYGAAAVAHLGPRCPVLLIHGAEDEVLPPGCSEGVFGMARHPKRLEMLPGTGHSLEESADMVMRMTRTWLREHLG